MNRRPLQSSLRSLLFPAVLTLTAPMHAQRAPSSQDRAQQILALANADRAAHQLPPLDWNPALARAALLHAEFLSNSPTLVHQVPGEPDLISRSAHAGAHFTAIAENLLRGADPSPVTIEQTWLSTHTHRVNLLNPDFNAAGIALLRTPNGVVVVEDLAQVVSSPSIATTEQAVIQALLQAGVPRAQVTSAARNTCLHPPSPGAATLLLTITWDGPETAQTPIQLPPALLQQLAVHPSSEVEVAACPGAATAQGFTTTRVAALLH